MSCRRCTEHPTEPLKSFAAGDPAASLRAAARARAARDQDSHADIHVHYDQRADAFVVLRSLDTAQVAA
ncbi:hypothetical protein [Streptacidiphilus carbonis]|uniref:hypothetical protein n=1 Tax=Streptacidiphilus carbonis TaxID=105422 RepID=UPI0005AA57A6|nr:hypothetical protein [Streptacidiphilus carbonis]